MNQDMRASRRILGSFAVAGFMAAAGMSSSAYGQDHSMDAPKMDTQSMAGGEHEVAHPFFSHMGMPEAVGVYSLRLGAVLTSAEDSQDGDFALHLETGLAKFIGVHLRNDGVVNRQHTELMFQFAAIRSADGMSGFAPIIEFEFPTHAGGDQRIYTLVGFSTALANSKAAFNQIVHYDPRTDMVEGSAALVVKVVDQLFPVVELSGEGMRGERPIMELLGGLKYRVNDNLLLGMAIQAPITNSHDVS